MTLAAMVLAQCFVMTDPTPGWKQITLPSSAPQLAAPEGYEQFRTSDTVVVTHELTEVLRSAHRAAPGRNAFDFTLPPHSTTVTLRFARSLDSAKVDAVVEGPRGRQTLLDGRRVSGASLSLPVSLPDAARAVVTVHHHLRDAPVLESATVERRVVPLGAGDFPPQLRLDNSLYLRSPGGPITVCQRPRQPLRMTSRALDDAFVRSAPLEQAPTR